MADEWPRQDRPTRYYTLPLTIKTKIDVSGPFPLTSEEWSKFKELLDVMEPGLHDADETAARRLILPTSHTLSASTQTTGQSQTSPSSKE